MELKRQPGDTPGMMILRWNDKIRGYDYDPQHHIAQKIGPDMEPF
jgi:hypothetical protein